MKTLSLTAAFAVLSAPAFAHPASAAHSHGVETMLAMVAALGAIFAAATLARRKAKAKVAAELQA